MQLTTGLSQEIRRSIKNFHITIFRGEKIKTQPCHHFLSDQLYLIKKHSGDPIVDSSRPLIVFEGDETLQSLVSKWLMDNDEFKFSQIIKVDQIETCKQLMKKGIGIAVLPQSAISDLGEEGYDKNPLFVDGNPLTRETWITYSKESETLPQVKAFLSIQNLL
ncbi:MAG: substrate-binding domain-containing protein [Bacillus sp. (in: Bacteria)]|nr:substrate-binding domain-containing protein [Bacillus sp. (in: firmicutes)]